jgi:hypothetical protein
VPAISALRSCGSSGSEKRANGPRDTGDSSEIGTDTPSHCPPLQTIRCLFLQPFLGLKVEIPEEDAKSYTFFFDKEAYSNFLKVVNKTLQEGECHDVDTTYLSTPSNGNSAKKLNSILSGEKDAMRAQVAMNSDGSVDFVTNCDFLVV